MISVDWSTRVIFIPRNDLTLVQATPTEIREMEVEWFRYQCMDLLDNEDGVVNPDIFIHNTEVLLGGLTYARVIEIINGYTITFEDGQYAVNIVGGNTNIADVVNVNQVSVRSSNSAGLISSKDIEYSSFQNTITIDIINGSSGTLFPIGTKREPVNNLADALLIAEYRGFKSITVLNDMIGVNALDAGNMDGFTILGNNEITTCIEILPAINVENCTIQHATISGTLDGGIIINDCRIFNLNYVSGEISNCGLGGTIILDGNAETIFKNCYMLDFDSVPVIDLNNSGQDLSVGNFNGILQLRNLNDATTDVNVGLTSGQLILEPSIISGNVLVAGNGLINDMGTSNPNDDALMNVDNVAYHVWDNTIATNLVLDVQFIKDIEGGRWIIDSALNQMIFYKDDNITEIARFDLTDATGQPTNTNVFERVRQ